MAIQQQQQLMQHVSAAQQQQQATPQEVMQQQQQHQQQHQTQFVQSLRPQSVMYHHRQPCEFAVYKYLAISHDLFVVEK